MNILSVLTRKISRAMFWICCVALLGIVFLTTCDVILRRLGKPIVFAYEVVIFLAAIVVGFALPESILKGVHVQMDFLTQYLSQKYKKILDVITRFLAAGTFLIVGWRMIKLGAHRKITGEFSAILNIPDYPIAYGIGICCFIACVALFIALLERLKERKGKSPEDR